MCTYGFIRAMVCLERAGRNLDLRTMFLDLSVAAIAIAGALDLMRLIANSN